MNKDEGKEAAEMASVKTKIVQQCKVSKKKPALVTIPTSLFSLMVLVVYIRAL